MSSDKAKQAAQEAGYSEDYGRVRFEYSLDELVDKARKSGR